MSEKIEILKNKISSSKAELLPEKEISLIKIVFEGTEDKFIQGIINYKKEDVYYNLIYYLLDLKENLGKDVSKSILKLYNYLLRENQDYIQLTNKKIIYNKKENIVKNIHLLSKLSFHFNNIDEITINDCKIKDFSLAHLEALFSDSLINLNLNNNKITDLTIFNKRQIYSNL